MANQTLSLNAGHLFSVAKRAYEAVRCDEPAARHICSQDALVAFVFSAIAAEAFINELAHIAASPEHYARTATPPREMAVFVTCAELFEEKQAATVAKFQQARTILAGSPFPKNSPPYQAFETLFKVRHWLVHYKHRDKIEYDAAGQPIVKLPPARG